MDHLIVPVSVGEVVDKITILQIKAERIKDGTKLNNVKTELNILTNVCQQHGVDLTSSLVAALKKTNEDLWDIEDRIRLKEKAQCFDQEFINLARSVYVTNDKRAKEKAAINSHFGSLLQEEKSYEDYTN